MTDQRSGWGRRAGERRSDGTHVTPVSVDQRVSDLEARVSRDRTENRVLYALVVGILVAGALLFSEVRQITASNTKITESNTELIAAQAESRRQNILVTCTALSAVIDAGRASILGQISAPLPPELDRNLQRLGYPPPEERQAAARVAAKKYSQLIAQEIEDVAHRDDLVNDDGTLDCKRISAETRPPPPQIPGP